ncbi:MAG: tRNA glutamyl-Q(34) synthetase GluQRS [Pseudomonadota bacterium]
MYVGRFAPSPTGALHFGSLVAALASFLDARAAGGKWLLRIENIDPPREKPGSADAIRRSLDRLGLHWDGPITFQSERSQLYWRALRDLHATGALFACECSRTQIAKAAKSQTTEGPLYPGTCRHREPRPLDDGAEGSHDGIAWRLRADASPAPIRFIDRIQGAQGADPSTDLGDFVLRRRDGYFAYQLAVAIDDQRQGITDVVRGVDLLPSTFRQLLVLRHIGAAMPTYAHIPIALDAHGHKLSKQEGASSIDAEPEAPLLFRALQFLQQNPPRELRRTSAQEVLTWAIAHWSVGPMRGMQAISGEPGHI